MDPRSQMAQAQTPEWLDSIPGYRGYKRKELRREADRALRMHLADKLANQLGRLDDAKRRLLSSGGLSQLGPIERTSTKLHTLVDTLKSASYGYAGLFDAASIREAQLDALYTFDQALDEQVDALGAKVEAVRAAVVGKAGYDDALDDLTNAIDELQSRVGQRQEAILTGQSQAIESPRAVLEAPKPVSAQFMALRALKLNDAVAIGEMNYVVSAREQAFLNGVAHTLLRLDTGSTSRWLWVGPTERDLALLEEVSPSEEPFKAEQVQSAGEALRLVSRGQGSLSLDGPSGKKRDLPAQIALFRSELQALWAERSGSETHVFSGLTTDTVSVQVFKR